MDDYRIEENIETDLVMADDRFLLEYRPGTGSEEDPVLLPPLLVPEKGRYLLVCGRDAVIRSRRKKRPLRYGFIAETDPDRRALVRSLVLIKREIYGFNHVEKALALRCYREPGGSTDTGFLMLLDIPKSPTFIEGYISLAGAPALLKDLVVAGDVDLLTAFEIFLFERSYWEAAVRFISMIKLGTKRRNRLLMMIREIALRDGTGPESIMNSPGIRKLLQQKIDPPHRGKKVSEAIERLRYPEMTKYREEFFERLRKVDLDPALTLTVPPDFEQWKFSVSFSFSSVEEYREKAGIIEKAGSGGALGELLGFRY